jgi:hypothetical protein
VSQNHDGPQTNLRRKQACVTRTTLCIPRRWHR